MRCKTDYSDQFVGNFIFHDGTGNEKIPKGHYRIELLWHNESDQGYWSAKNGHVRTIYICMSDKEGKLFDQPLDNFLRGPWKEIKDEGLIGWLCLQWT